MGNFTDEVNFVNMEEAVQDYRSRRKWKPVLNRPGTKAPLEKGWPGREVEEASLLAHCRADGPVGIQTGLASGILDVDCDVPEAWTAAPAVLPQTCLISGRPGAEVSHYWYGTRVRQAHLEFHDLPTADRAEGEMLVELRGENHQTVVPPSTYPEGNGGRYAWARYGEPTSPDNKTLVQRVKELATVALLARHWPGRTSKARHTAFRHLAGALVNSDYDPEGAERIVRGVVAATGDEEGGDRVRALHDSLRNGEDGRNLTGWPTLAEVVGDAVVSRAREWLGLRSRTQPRATEDAGEAPLPTEPPWPAPLAVEAFHGLAGEVVRVLEPASEADPAALMFQLLVMFGNVVGRGPYFAVEADRHYTNEYLVLVGRTSIARKGTSWGQSLRTLASTDEAWSKDRIQSGLSSGEGLIWAVRDPITKRERVKEKGEVRYEDVEADPGIEDKRLLVFEPEFANVLKQTERQGNILSTVIRQAWDSGSLRTLTKNTPARATGAHVSIVGHITCEELRRCLSATETANGFGNRFPWVCVDRSKLLPEGGEPDAEALARVQGRLSDAVAFARGVGAMCRDDEARELWRGVYGDLSEGKPGLTGALLGRGPAHVMRLATIYALLDTSTVIRPPHLLAALALWDYVEQSIRHIFGDSLGDPVADEVLRLLRGAPQGLTRTDIHNLFGRNQTANRLADALRLLLKHRLVRTEHQETGGRPAERWIAARH